MAEAFEESAMSNVPKPGGCSLGAFVWGAVMIGVGVFLMNRWEALGGASRAGAVALVVVGTLLVLPLVLIGALRVVVRVLFRRAMKTFSKSAEGIVANMRSMYEKEHEFREATPADFEGLDVKYYEDTARALSECGGYRHLGDLVDKTIEQIMTASPPIRVLAAADGTHTVAIYHVDPTARFRSDAEDDDDDEDNEDDEDEDDDQEDDEEEDDDDRDDADEKKLICDVATEFSDGTFLMTSNTEGQNQMTPPPQIEQRLFPPGTPVPELLRAHVAEHHKLLAAKGPDVRPVTINTLADAIESERRAQAVKNAFRKGIGFVEPNEIRRIMSRETDDPSVEDAVVDAVDKARKREGE